VKLREDGDEELSGAAAVVKLKAATPYPAWPRCMGNVLKGAGGVLAVVNWLFEFGGHRGLAPDIGIQNATSTTTATKALQSVPPQSGVGPTCFRHHGYKPDLT
jgi:hypothetical protein